jgi:hypothetical protein
MNLKSNDIDTGNLKEGEEIYSPEAKRVEALDFHPRRTGSSPVRRTKNDHEMIVGNGDQMIIGKTEEEIGYMRRDWTIGFNTFTTGKCAIVNGKPHARLGFSTT